MPFWRAWTAARTAIPTKAAMAGSGCRPPFRQLGRSNLSDVETQALEGPDHGVTTGEIVWFEWFESALVTMRGSR